MIQKPFQPAEDAAKTRLLELMQCGVIGPMHTQTMRSCRYSIMFTERDARYTEVYVTKAKSEVPTKFKEYLVTVQKQHLRSKVCRNRVDGGGEYASREKFLEYFAEEGISMEVSAPYSQLLLETVPDRHVRSCSGSNPNLCQIVGPVCQ